MLERPLKPIIRRAFAGDAPSLADARGAAERERHPEIDADVLERLVADTTTFFARELGRGDPGVYAWLATLDERTIGVAALTVVATLPRPSSATALDGRIRNVYVVPGARRRGIAIALVRLAIAEAERIGVDRLTLGASPAGRPLYEKLGFARKDDEMLYFPERSLTS